jgi:spore coat-associated protein N
MRKEMLSVLTIGLVLTFAGSGTFAMFSDSETSTGNTFTAGNHKLRISDQDEDWRDGGVTATWVMENMKPGDSTSGWIGFEAKGGSSITIACSYTLDEGIPGGNTADDMAKELVITEMHYYGELHNHGWGWEELDLLTNDNYDVGYEPNPGNPGPMVEDMDGDGSISLYDLNATVTSVDVERPKNNENSWLNMAVKFDEDAGNDFQGDTLNLTMIFTLH